MTVACVPTGMYTGVSMTPWGVCRRPRRAPVCLQMCKSSNSKGLGNLRVLHCGMKRLRRKKTATCAGRRKMPVCQAARRSLTKSATEAAASTANAAPTGRELSPDLGTVSSMTRAAISMLKSISPFSSKASMR